MTTARKLANSNGSASGWNQVNRIVALLMLFPRLPELSHALSELKRHLPLVLECGNRSGVPLDDADHVFVHPLIAQ
ncbi:hypothetical protein DQ04_07401010 [Trypanosoma grayi]|uniref:hypothetical protein n=1 Tax=Trypanosoma grayi TaxID=71804 RepID=UPI0004F483F7|nr:hypothetical protein DQ04_07401010 [Trypanosoma grayi]KEG08346.1 hypothetical protein DQ04_07401010 [Trypanosoma grayi]